jgi:hypothetical protein
MLTDREVALALVVVIATWVFLILRMHRHVGGWLDFVLKDSAYGVITQSGIQYWSILRPHFVPWTSVERIEYSPRNGDRIDVFRIGAFTFSRVRPIQFGTAPVNREAIQEIGRILGEHGASGKLVVTESVPEKFFRL